MSTRELLIGTHIEEPALLPPGTPLMKRMCGRCELVLGWKICAPAMAGTVTHGFCDECAAIALDELDQLMPRREALAPAPKSTRA